MNVFNPAQFRAQFPALQDAGVYLDSAATALKPEAVVEASRQFYSLSAGNWARNCAGLKTFMVLLGLMHRS
ncbi:hypothetical protein AWG79_03225 [Escherichia coli]|nr:hypothetical protein AWG79_03225 [Escherichia coli]